MKLYHPLTLTFKDTQLEKNFIHGTSRRTRVQGQIVVFIGIFVYLLMAILDQWFVPVEVSAEVWTIRLITLIVPAIVLLISLTPLFEGFNYLLLALVGLAAGIGIITIQMSLPIESSAYYYPMMIAITFFTYNFVGTRFIYAFGVDILLLVLYNIAFGILIEYPFPILVAHNFFIITANLVGGVAGYMAEWQRRTLFLREQELEDRTEKLQLLNETLDRRVQEEVENNIKKDRYLITQSRQAQMGEMISMIAHQWRQPLGAIAMASSTLQLDIRLKNHDIMTQKGREECFENFTEGLENINNYVENLTTTIDDFRNFYKPNKRSIKINTETIILKSLNIIRASLEHDKIKIVQEYNSKEEIEIYDNEMMQVILNILKNAQDNFKEKETGNPYIKIITEGKTISIFDNGGGIAEDILPKIFDPYFSTKDEKNGTGLGLYMSKIIIEDHHNGKLLATNIDEGFCFRIELQT